MFGDILGELLETHLGHRKAKMLAEHIGVDPSLVRRWLRGERVPSLDSNYVDWIADALTLTSQERDRLHQAQIETLSVPQKSLKKVRRPRLTTVRQLLSPAVAGPHPLPGAVADSGALRDAYAGEGAFLRAFAAAVNSLPNAPDTPRPEILITMPTRPDSANTGEELTALWENALILILRKGWNYSFLSARLRSNSVRELTRRLVQLASTGPGSFATYSLKPESVTNGPDHLAIFPDVALLGLTSAPARAADATLVHTHPPHVELLRGYFDSLLRLAQPVVTLHGPRDFELTADIAALERLPGDHMLVKDGFSVLNLPPEWVEVDRLWTAHTPLSLDDFARIVRANQERQAHFFDAVREHRWMDVSSQRAILELADTGRFRSADLVQYIVLEPAERIVFLRHLIGLLKRYPHYHLALTADEEAHVFAPAMWLVHGMQGVVLRRHTPDGKFNSIVARDRRIARGFRQYFISEIWNGIMPKHRDRDWVIDFITGAIERVEAAADDPR